jgi:hypothetical protein
VDRRECRLVTAQVVCYVTKQWVRNGHSLKIGY